MKHAQVVPETTRTLLVPGDHYGERKTLKEMSEEEDERCVVMNMKVYKLSHLDAAAGQFQVEISLHMFWFEKWLADHWEKLPDDIVVAELVENDSKQMEARYENKALAVPEIQYMNALSKEVVQESLIELRKAFPKGVVHYEQRLRLVCAEEFELMQFPFDVQVCSITLRANSKRDDAMKRYFAIAKEGEPGSRKRLNMEPSVRLTEWHLYRPTSEVTTDHDQKKATDKKKPVYRAHVRRPDTP